MLRVQPVESFDAPDLQPYRTMRRQLEHQQQRIFVAEGEKVVRRLLQSRFPVLSLLLPAAWLEELRPLAEARPEMIHAYVGEKPLLETLTNLSMYQGVMAVGRIPPLPSVETILETAPPPRLFVAVEGISNADNLGVLVRNCAAFRAQALIVGETSCSPFLRRAVRSSMGTIFQLPVVEPPNLREALRQLRRQNVRCLAAHPRADEKTLARTNLTGDCCFVFGPEGAGLSPEILAACDDAVAIPMPPTVDSLNVGSAGAVFLYEASRQRGQM